MKYLFFLFIITLMFFSCVNNKTDSSNNKLNNQVIEKVFSKSEIAKYTISSIFNQPYEKMDVIENYDIYYVSYKQEKDSLIKRYKIKIDSNRIIWANSGADGGRWRNTKYDEIIKYSIKGDTLKIGQFFNDGSKIIKEFIKKE